MKTSTIVKSLATVVAFAGAGFAQAQQYPISGGWDREASPNQVTGDYIDINQNPSDPCVAALRGLSLTVNNPDGFSAFGETFVADSATPPAGPTWSKSFPVDEPNGICGLQPDSLVPMGPLGGSTGLSGKYRVLYNWGESAASCGSDASPALSFTAGVGSASPNDWSCAQLSVIADVDLDNNTFTPLSINLKVHGIDGNINNWLNYDLY